MSERDETIANLLRDKEANLALMADKDAAMRSLEEAVGMF